MGFLQKRGSEWSLRLGLGIMYLYSGYDIIMHPSAWQWAVIRLPQFIQNSINQLGVDTYLKVQGISEAVLGLLLLVWILPRIALRWVSFLIALEMAGILFFVGVDAITFRDIGLLGAAASLFFITVKPYGSI